MTSFKHIPTVVSSLAISSCLLLTVAACQPTTDAEPAETIAEASVDEHHDHDHNEHAHDEHAHDEHDHDEHHNESEHHDHDEHNEHDEHDHDEHNAHDEHGDVKHDEHAGHHHAHRIAFACKPEMSIDVHYHDDSTPETAHLLIDGIEYDLTEASNATANSSEKTYASPIGIEDGTGMVWQTTANNAMLFTVPANDIATDSLLNNATASYECHQVS